MTKVDNTKHNNAKPRAITELIDRNYHYEANERFEQQEKNKSQQ